MVVTNIATDILTIVVFNFMRQFNYDTVFA